jgi:hypothetical protein
MRSPNMDSETELGRINFKVDFKATIFRACATPFFEHLPHCGDNNALALSPMTS